MSEFNYYSNENDELIIIEIINKIINTIEKNLEMENSKQNIVSREDREISINKLKKSFSFKKKEKNTKEKNTEEKNTEIIHNKEWSLTSNIF